MKIRNGFVSNSSASSFIVKHIDRMMKDKSKGLLDKKTIHKLEKYGFKSTLLSHPSHLDHTKHDDLSIWKPMIDEKTNKVYVNNYGYWVSCNENDVIKWLVKNNIGFIATVHYGHQIFVFHKNDKHVMVFENFGSQVETYHQYDSWEKITKEWKLYGERPPYYRIPISRILKKDW